MNISIPAQFTGTVTLDRDPFKAAWVRNDASGTFYLHWNDMQVASWPLTEVEARGFEDLCNDEDRTEWCNDYIAYKLVTLFQLIGSREVN